MTSNFLLFRARLIRVFFSLINNCLLALKIRQTNSATEKNTIIRHLGDENLDFSNDRNTIKSHGQHLNLSNIVKKNNSFSSFYSKCLTVKKDEKEEKRISFFA